MGDAAASHAMRTARLQPRRIEIVMAVAQSRTCCRLLTALFVAVAAVSLAGCREHSDSTPAPTPAAASLEPPLYEDVTERVGLDFLHDAGPTDTHFMPQSMGSGCAFLDADGDGLLDIYLLQFGGPDSKSVNRLYRQGDGGKFVDATEGSGLDFAGHNHGVAVGDVNNDGRPDVMVTQYGGIKLLVNREGVFEDVSEACGLFNPLWGMSTAFLDYDRDGWLDVVIVNYLDYDPKNPCFAPNGAPDFCGPTHFAPRSAKLFRNLGAAAGDDSAAVRFDDVSLQAGIAETPGPGLGVTVGDFDGDGWTDIFVANDGRPNRLWINRHDGTFADEAVSRGIAFNAMGKAFAGMGVAIGDIDGDALIDVFVTHLNTETHTLWKQGPRGLFTDKSAETKLSAATVRATGFGTLMADFTNAGAVDIAAVNGRVYLGGPAKETQLGFWETYAEKNMLLANDGQGHFRDISASNPAFCGDWNVARGLACADYDNDGGIDLLMTTIGGRARLFRNVAPQRGHWLQVRAVDPRTKRDAYGAEVRVKSASGQQVRWINPSISYLSSSAPTAHFGLGQDSGYDSLVVAWPDGQVEQFPGGTADLNVEVRQGEGRKP